MGLFTKDIATMDDLFIHRLKAVYYAEHQITETLPVMREKATSPDLKQGFETHLRETEGQIRRLEQVFQMHGTAFATCPLAQEEVPRMLEMEVSDCAPSCAFPGHASLRTCRKRA